MFVGLTVVGYAGLVWIALAPLTAVAARLPVLPTAVVAAAAVWGADLLALGLKAAFGRDRPFEVIADPDPLITGTVGHSLPSGHAATSAAGAFVLSALAPRVAPLFVLLALGIAYSRVYVGAHYPFDVVLGAAIGVAAGLIAVRLMRLRRREGSPPP